MRTEAGSAGSTWIEKHVIYGSLNIVGYANHLLARSWRKLQSGMVHHYAAIIVAGLFILVHLVLLMVDRCGYRKHHVFVSIGPQVILIRCLKSSVSDFPFCPI